MQRTRTVALVAAMIVMLFPASASANPHAQAAPTPQPELPIVGGGEIVTTQLVDYLQAVQLDAYLTAVHDGEMQLVGQYVDAVHAGEVQAAIERQQAQAYVAPQRQTPVASSGTVGDCSGFSIPSYIIQRESGGNPNAVNPSSGAYGCAQTLPSHYAAGGACAGLDMYSVDGQRQCVNILSNGGTDLRPWAL